MSLIRRTAYRAALCALTVLCASAQPLAAEPVSSLPHHFVALDDTALFLARTVGHPEPWPEHTGLFRTDGTAAGTFELRLCGSACDPRAAIVATSPELAFVTAFDETLAWQLWRTDGSQSGTRRLTSFEAVSQPVPRGQALWAAETERLFFFVEEVMGWSLWVSNGTAAGTVRVAAFPAAVQTAPFGLAEHQGSLYFFVSPSEPNTGAYELWKSGGTAATTSRVITFPGFVSGFDSTPVSLPEGLVFPVQTPDGSGRRMWRSDGTAAGTAPLAAVAGVELDFQPRIADIAGLGWFWGIDGSGRQMWATDGSESGTRKLTSIPGGNYRSGVLDPLPWQGGVVFGAEDHTHGFELWASDGTAAGTGRLFDLCPGICSTMPVLSATAGDVFYFTTHDPALARTAPWVSDGTLAGTRQLSDVSPFQPSHLAPALFLAEDHLFFRGSSGLDFEQLWSIERSSGLVRRVTDLGGGGHDRFGAFWDPAVLGELFVFPADDGVHGLEPWVSDGTPEGTRMLADLATGGDGFPSCQPSADVLCLQGNRFQVEVAWNDHHNGGSGLGHAIPAATSDLTGYFWFFAPDNVELIVKILDGTTLNDFYWTFYGALTDVEYEITVTDTVTGESRSYHNPPGEICGQGDIESLPGGGSTAGSSATRAAASRQQVLSLPAGALGGVVAAAHPAAACVPDAGTLCLLDGRFRVRVEWQDQHNGGEGTGGALPFSDASGFFWFFTPDNVELVVKALDARVIDGHFWLFYGALSDVGYTITVEDLVDGHRTQRYVNPPGEICGRGDTAAFSG